MNQSDLETQILTLLDGELSGEESAALEARLLNDEAARATYGKLVLLHNALETRFSVSAAVEQMAVVPVERIMSRQRRRVVKGSLLAAAAILLVSAIAMWMILAPDRPVAVGTFRTAPDALFALTYEGDGEAPAGKALVVGSRLRLAEGTLEGVFESGVRLVAQAPCNLRVLSRDRVTLEEGAVWFQVPAPAAGFAVETPDLVVVDLGTEFGVLSETGKPDQVHVMKGRVEVTSRHEPGETQTLQAGEARLLDQHGRLSETDSDPSLFLTKFAVPRAIAIANHSFEADVIPRDGNRATKQSGKDDYDKEFLPSAWLGFDDGVGGTGGTRGILSTAPDSAFGASLNMTPDSDPNDQVFFSAARDIYQVLAEPLQANRTYVLSVNIGDRALAGDSGNPGSPGIRLGAGAAPGNTLLEPVSTRFPTQVDGGWVTWTATYKTGPSPAGADQPLRIELTSGSQVSWFDNVRLTVVP